MSLSDSQVEAGHSPIGAVLILSRDSADASRRNKGRGYSGVDRLESALRAAGLEVIHVQLREGRKAKSTKYAGETSVKRAMDRLSETFGENGNRIALVAEGKAADQAVLRAGSDRRVRSLCFLSGRLTRKAQETLLSWRDNPSLCLVSSEDKKSLRDMADVYFASDPAITDIRIFERLGRGTDMFESWGTQFPQAEPLEHTVADWIRCSLASDGSASEASFETEDGWQIFGNLRMPVLGDGKVPGVVLLHSGRSDRYIFADLERMLVRAGFAVLNIDWRGRGKSINKGRYFELSKTERANGKLDAKAAIDFLSSKSEIDRDRISLVGVVHGAEHAVRASIDDPRVKALALLTGYIPASDEERSFIISGRVHVMYVTCDGHRQVTRAMRELYEETPGRLTRLIVYKGGAIGYQLFDLDRKLEPTIVDWLKEALAK